MSKLKTGGFNFQDLDKDNTDIQDIFDFGEEKDMEKELRLKKRKKKPDFGFLFPTPKDNENMGMDNISDGKPFEGLF